MEGNSIQNRSRSKTLYAETEIKTDSLIIKGRMKAGREIARKYRRNHIKMLQNKEYQKLKNMVPWLKERPDIECHTNPSKQIASLHKKSKLKQSTNKKQLNASKFKTQHFSLRHAHNSVRKVRSRSNSRLPRYKEQNQNQSNKKVTKIEVIESAIEYIDQLHRALAIKMQQQYLIQQQQLQANNQPPRQLLDPSVCQKQQHMTSIHNFQIEPSKLYTAFAGDEKKNSQKNSQLLTGAASVLAHELFLQTQSNVSSTKKKEPSDSKTTFQNNSVKDLESIHDSQEVIDGPQDKSFLKHNHCTFSNLSVETHPSSSQNVLSSTTQNTSTSSFPHSSSSLTPSLADSPKDSQLLSICIKDRLFPSYMLQSHILSKLHRKQ